MITIRTYIILLFSLLLVSFTTLQPTPEKAGKMEDGKFTITIDLNWDADEMARVSALFDLDSTLMKAITSKNIGFINDSTYWKANLRNENQLVIYKELGQDFDLVTEKNIFFSTLDKSTASVYPTLDVNYGVNDFSEPEVFSYQRGSACFTLPGYQSAGKVVISGSFNLWSTVDLPMQKTASGWKICLDIEPGKHLYKFIVDGRWIHDPNNKNRERDGNRGFNSVVFCNNHTFTLNGYQRTRRVYLTGSFNGWNTREIRMIKTETGWHLPMYLKEGTHTYKYIADGTWITDPTNPLTRPDGNGNTNSLLAIGDTTYFTLKGYSNAREVYLSGSFNEWNQRELAMQKTADGWQLPYVLGHGNYEYKFIVDGKWITDPENPYSVGSGDFQNSFLAHGNNYQFSLGGFPEAQNVIVTGSFNGWSTSDYRMVYKDGSWTFPIYLHPGRYSYKYIIDGEWVHDTENPLWETNEFGGKNSVLWIEP